MLTIGPDAIDAALTFPGLVETLREAFRGDTVQPLRHHHAVRHATGADTTLLLMPAWTQGGAFIGVKIVTVSPDNNTIGKPAVMGTYLLLDGTSGEPLASIDGQRLTAWRTAAASALASSYLSRADARTLLMIGTGALAPFVIGAHASVRPIEKVLLWNRTRARAERLRAELSADGFDAVVVDDLDKAVSGADIVSAATISSEQLVHGAALSPGTHVDLIGAFSPTMRESDDEAVRKARIFVDTREGAVREAGDIVQAISSGALAEEDIVADLHELCRGMQPGRRSNGEITLFKSVGAALEDLAAAIAIYRVAAA